MNEQGKHAAATSEQQQFAGNSCAEGPSGRRDPEALSQEVPVRVMGYRANCDASGQHWQREAFEEDTTTTHLFPRGAVIPLKAAVAWGQNLMLINLRNNRYAHCRVANLRNAADIYHAEVEFTHTIPDFWGVSFSRDAASAVSEIAAIAAQFAAEPVAARPLESPASTPQWALAAAAGSTSGSAGTPAAGCAPENAATVILKRPSPAPERNGADSSAQVFVPRPMECIPVGEPVGEPFVQPVDAPPAECADAAPVPPLTIRKPEAARAPRRRSARRAAAAAAALGAVLVAYYIYSPAEAALPTAIPASMNFGSLPAANAGNQTLQPAATSDDAEPEAETVVSVPVPEIEPETTPNQRVVLVSKMILPLQSASGHLVAAPELPLTGGAAPASTADKSQAVLGPIASSPPPPEEAPAKPQPVADELTPAHLVSSVQPIYPPEAVRVGVEGDVVLKINISSAGTITEVKVVSGPQELRGAARVAVEQWKYEPALLRGRPTESAGVVTLKFRLR